MRLAAFYHIYAGGLWQQPVDEYLAAIDRSSFDGPLYVGLVGHERQRAWVVAALGDRGVVIAAEDEGYESVTLARVRAYALVNDGAVMYAHTKGAYRLASEMDTWRRVLTDTVVCNWRSNVERLCNSDAIGHVWFDERVGWRPGGFVGNFWIARCDYLRALPAPEDAKDRGQAEVWIGRGNPRVTELAEWDREIGPPIPGLAPYWRDWLRKWRPSVTAV